MIKPHLWSKSVNAVSQVYWWIKCVEAGKNFLDYNSIEEIIDDLTNSPIDNT